MDPQVQNLRYQGTDQAASRVPEADSVVTLLIRHLPEAIPHDTLTRLFSHYGAFSVRACTTGRAKNCAFVDFKNEAVASQAQHQLNGLRFLGKVLSVQIACKPKEANKLQQAKAQPRKDSAVRDLSDASESGSALASEPIAARLGVDYSFPPHLEYAYPPPDGNILTNIVNALIAVPNFYTQVLHLMNKMNIPAPFRMALPTPPLPPAAPAVPPPLPPPPPAASNFRDPSSSESEMESSEEEVHPLGTAKSRRKRHRREAIVGPAVNKDVTHETVGVKPVNLMPKELPLIKKKNSILQIKINPKGIKNEEKDDRADKEANTDGSDSKPFLNPEELEGGKLPAEEILSLPMFKNYTAGNPAPVLYIKNLAKDVTPDDFYFLFGSLFGTIDAAKSGLSVKLMQEGRMRGQAFVTFPSIELAQCALNLSNGYVFKGKPMIIQFGRNTGAAKPN